MLGVVDRLADAIVSVAAPMGTGPVTGTSLEAYWYLSPRQHVLEFFLFTALYVFFFRRASKGKVVVLRQGADTSYQFDKWDYLLRAVLTVSFAYIVICKYWSDRMWFMLMPCHVLTSCLLVLLFSKARFTTTLFNCYLYYTFMPILAIIFPDHRDYIFPFEVFDYYLQHILMILLPPYFLIRKRFTIYGGAAVYTRAYIYGAIYFTHVLGSLAVLTGFNLNYMMAPPRGLLTKFGIYYRLIQQCFCLLLALFVKWAHFQITERLAPPPKHKKNK